MAEAAAGGSAGSGAGRDFEIVRIAARAYETDRYMAALLAPVDKRGDLMTLGAFAGEVARIPSMVAEPMAGEIRLQWWRDVLEHDAACSSGHPIADAMLNVIARHRLPIAAIERYIDGIGARLYAEPFAEEADLLAHTRATEGVLFALAARILDERAVYAAGEAIDAAAEALGLARLILEFAPVLAEGRCRIPTGLLAAHGIAPGDLAAEALPAGLRLALGTLVGRSRDRLRAARVALRTQPRAIHSALLPIAMVEPYLAASERARDPRREVSDVLPFTRPWRLWWANAFARP